MSRTILAIGTHPDDIEIGCGGTIAQFFEQDYKLVFVIVTSGEEGSLEMPKAHLKNIREDESINSARRLGAKEIIFLREPDGLVQISKETKTRLISIIRETKPLTVFTHAKSDHFPDHRIVHDLSMAAITAAAGPWYQDAHGNPHRVANVFGYEVWNPINEARFFNDISENIETKIDALKLHASQTNNVNYLAAVRGLAAYRGATSMNGKFAEAFEVLKLGGIV